MIPDALSPIANHLWQSTLFAGVAGLLTLALRKNPARVRYWVWVAASLKFLVPFSVLVAIGSRIEWRTVPAMAPKVSVVMEQFSQPFTAPTVALPVPAKVPPSDHFLLILFGIWGCGFVGISMSWWIKWMRIRNFVRAGSAVQIGLPIRAVSSKSFQEPGIFGVFRPVLLLPEGILERLTPEQWNAVVAHELCHVRYRDNLVAVIQMCVETIFWFHPLLWWVGKRIISERERGCDEEVLRLGSERRTYAEGMLRVCELYVEARSRCITGATGADLRKRVQAILAGPTATDLSIWRKAMLAVFGILCLALPVFVGLLNPPMLQGQGGVSVPLPPPAASFRSASIERCKTYVAGGILDSAIFSPAPGQLIANCVTVASLIHIAYRNSVDGLFAGGIVAPGLPLSGEPNWVDSGNYLYRIDARADLGTSLVTMEGGMLQSLLADRFGLEVERVTRELPMYALVAAKNGARLKRSNERSCTGAWPRDLRFAQPLNQRCMAFSGREAQYEALQGEAITLEQFCSLLAGPLGRPVVDKTGIAGKFDFSLKFADDDTPAAVRPLYPSLQDVLKEQLGLKLDATTGPRDFLVIDRVEKPLPD